MRAGRALVLSLASSVLGCGPVVFEPETWMVGTFTSVGHFGCTSGDYLRRFIVHEGGRFDVVQESVYSGTQTWHAQWEQHEPGRFRVMRDEAHTDARDYPVEEGTEWDVMRSFECEPSSGTRHGVTWHRFYEVDLATGERKHIGGMVPGAMCAILDDRICTRAQVVWCEGTEPTPDCFADDEE